MRRSRIAAAHYHVPRGSHRLQASLINVLQTRCPSQAPAVFARGFHLGTGRRLGRSPRSCTVRGNSNGCRASNKLGPRLPGNRSTAGFRQIARMIQVAASRSDCPSRSFSEAGVVLPVPAVPVAVHVAGSRPSTGPGPRPPIKTMRGWPSARGSPGESHARGRRSDRGVELGQRPDGQPADAEDLHPGARPAWNAGLPGEPDRPRRPSLSRPGIGDSLTWKPRERPRARREARRSSPSPSGWPRRGRTPREPVTPTSRPAVRIRSSAGSATSLSPSRTITSPRFSPPASAGLPGWTPTIRAP